MDIKMVINGLILENTKNPTNQYQKSKDFNSFFTKEAISTWEGIKQHFLQKIGSE